MPPGNALAEEQIRRNRQTALSWNDAAGHRRQVTERLLALGGADRRLCVLGAGNSNDLELAALVAAFGEVHLVDLDAEALAAGVSRQGVADSGQIVTHGGIDVTGAMDRLAALKQSPNSPGSSPLPLDELVAEIRTPPRLELTGPFDVVASVALVSQLVELAALALGDTHPRANELALALRDQHLELLIALTKPGGAVLLVTDFVSSTTCPQLADPALATAGPERLAELTARLVEAKNFFTGINPFALRRMWESDERFASRLEQVHLAKPWLWQLGGRAFAVTALGAKRRADS